MATKQPLGDTDSVPLAAATLARISAIVVPKRTRASRPKVRTGCGTCKKRHVKCDETRPKCVRCEQAGAECSGYKPVGRDFEGKPDKKDPVQRQMVKSMALGSRRQAPDLEGGDLEYPIPPPCSAALQLQDDEAMYYDFFRYQLAYDLMGFFPCNFWTETVLSEATHNDCVLHSMIALSALSRSLERDAASLKQPFDGLPVVALVETSQALSNLHARQAVRHYTKAMGLFRAHISSRDEVSAREVLIVTLLFVGYELLHGNIPAADSLLHSGSVLLKHENRSSTQRGGSSPHRQWLASSDAFQLERMLTRLLVSSYFSPVTASPTSIFCFEFASNPHVDIPVLGKTTVFDFFQLWKEFSARAFAFIQQHLASILLNLSFDVEASRQNQAEYLQYLRLWQEALRDFAQSNGDVYHAGLGPDKATVARGLRVIEIHIIMCRAYISGCLDRTGLAYDDYDSSYRAIIDLSTPLVAEAAPMNRSRFTFDIALVPMVGFIISCCRKRSIRMEALELYRKMSWREGAWDSRAMTIGKLGLIRLEESGASTDGFIPPESRYYWTGSNWDAKRRKLLATYYRMMPDDRGRPVVKEILMDI